ncbi:hypothetical protein E4T42_06026 [Aureobasidium subglaciale]|nr:hypothetical protein E4T42_06026 [Aureobasidium subglaciale]
MPKRKNGGSSGGPPAKKPRQDDEDEVDEVADDFFEIKSIIGERVNEYRVDWQDIGSKKFTPTWEPKENVTDAAIEEWEGKKRLKEQRKSEGTAGKRKGKARDTAGPSSGSFIQFDSDEEDDSKDTQRPSKPAASASRQPVTLKLKKPVKLVTETAESAPNSPEPPEKKPGRPSKSATRPQSEEDDDDDDDDIVLMEVTKPVKRGRGRPRKLLPEIGRQKEQDDEDVQFFNQPAGPAKSSPLQPSNRQKAIQDDGEVASPAPLKRGPGRPRKSLLSRSTEQLDQQSEKRKPGRPKKLSRATLDSSDEDSNDKLSRIRRKSGPQRTPVVPISIEMFDIPDDDAPIQVSKARTARVIPESSNEGAEDVPQTSRQHIQPNTAPVAVGNPSTPAGAARPDEAGTTEVEESDLDSAAAQLQRETRSAHKQLPVDVEQASRELDEDEDEEVSDFHSSQVLRGTQQEPVDHEEQSTSFVDAEESAALVDIIAISSSLDNLDDSTAMVDAAAASSLSAKNSPYEPGTTTGSTLTYSSINSSSGVHTMPVPVAISRRFAAGVVIPDSQSHLDGTSLHLSEPQIEQVDISMRDVEDVEDVEDDPTEIQIVVEGNAEQDSIPESSVVQVQVQMSEDAPQPNVATQSEPSLDATIGNIINPEPILIAVSSPVAQVSEQILTRSVSPASEVAARSSSTSSAPPTEVPDKSTQTDSQQFGDSQSQQEDEISFQSQPNSPRALNQQIGQNTASVEVTTQQSHVEQAAQLVSFQQQQQNQPPPTLEFAVRSSAEDLTTSSSTGLLTQVPQPPVQRGPTLVASVQDTLTSQYQKPPSADSSSPVPAIPSQFSGTIGESAPSPIRAHTLDSNMSGTPRRTTKERVDAMRAAVKLRFDAEEIRIAAEEAAAEAAEQAAEQAATRTAPAMSLSIPSVSSPKPASAVPARLMSPAVTDREVRSPSTVPPVEIIPEQAPEEYSRSERYETLLPGQEPQINASRAYVSQDLDMPDASVVDLDHNQHLVSLDFGTLQRSYYKGVFGDCKSFVDEFTLHKVWPAETGLAYEARAFIHRLHNYVNHPDLENVGTFDSTQASPATQAEWDESISSKFRFLKTLLDVAKRHNLHLALLVEPGRLAGILQNFLQATNIMYNVIDGENNVVNQSSTATMLLTTVTTAVDMPLLDMDMIVVLPGSLSDETITRTQKMLSHNTLVPTISLVVPFTIEHAERCLSSTVSESERLHVLVSTTTGERLNAGWQNGGNESDFSRKASDIIAWILNPAESDWPLYGLPEMKLIEAIPSQPSSEDELAINGDSNKRQLDVPEVPLAKKARVEESLPLTINPNDMHLPSGEIPHSHISDSVPASQHASTLQELNRARQQVSDWAQDMEKQQFNCEEQRAQMVQAQKERNEALESVQRVTNRLEGLQTKNISLRDEVLDLKKQLGVAQVALLNHTIPERAELEQSKADTLAAVADRDKEIKRTKATEEQLDYLRDQYQSRSNENTSLAAANTEQERRISALEIRASGEQTRLRTINVATYTDKVMDDNRRLKIMLREREGTIQRVTEENVRLRETTRGRVGTRATSIPRSPARANARESLSRQGSPSIDKRPPHPLSKSTTKE